MKRLECARVYRRFPPARCGDAKKLTSFPCTFLKLVVQIPRSNELVDQVFQEFLPPAGVRRDVTLLEHVSFEVFEAGFAGFDLRADATVPRAVALPHELSEPTILANGSRDFQPARKCVHAADV